MVTAILVLTALVIAVVTYSLLKVSSECSRIEESAEWARKWNEQRAKEASENHKWCDDDCYRCSENDWCKFSEVK